MKLAVPKERRYAETRVAATPETVKKFKALGLDVTVETGAGAAARISDSDYEAAGATIAPDPRTALADADIVLTVRGPDAGETALIRKGGVRAALLSPPLAVDCSWRVMYSTIVQYSSTGIQYIQGINVGWS